MALNRGGEPDRIDPGGSRKGGSRKGCGAPRARAAEFRFAVERLSASIRQKSLQGIVSPATLKRGHPNNRNP
jgi:hypothetical protein